MSGYVVQDGAVIMNFNKLVTAEVAVASVAALDDGGGLATPREGNAYAANITSQGKSCLLLLLFQTSRRDRGGGGGGEHLRNSADSRWRFRQQNQGGATTSTSGGRGLGRRCRLSKRREGGA